MPERVQDATRVAPYLTHVVRHHGQLTLIPPDNAGRVRKEERERKRRVPRADASTSAIRIQPSASGSNSRRDRAPRPASQLSVRPEDRVSMSIPDYPPPSFEEAIQSGARSPYSASAATSVLSLTTAPSSRAPSPPPPIPPARSHAQPRLQLHSPVRENHPRCSMQVNTSDAESDHDSELEPEPEADGAGSEDSGEMIEAAEATGATTNPWEQDRLAGYSLKQRMERERARQLLAEPPPAANANSTPRRSRSRLNLLLAASPSKLNLLSPSSSQLNLSMPSSSSRPEGLSPTTSIASSLGAQRPSPVPRTSSPPPRSARVASRSPTRGERATSRSPTRSDRSPREVRFDTDADGDVVGGGSPVRTAFPRRGRAQVFGAFGASSASLVSPLPSPEVETAPAAKSAVSSDVVAEAQSTSPLRSLFSSSQLSLPLHFLSSRSNDPEATTPSTSGPSSTRPSRPISTPGSSYASGRPSRAPSRSPTRVSRATSQSPNRDDWSPEEERFDTDVDGDIVGSGSPVRTAFPRRGLMHLLPGFTGSSASLVSPFPSPESHLQTAQTAIGQVSSNIPAVAQTPSPPRSSFSTSQLSLPLHILSRPGSPPRKSWRRGSVDSPTASSPSPLSLATYLPPTDDKAKDSLESWELLDASVSDAEAFQSVNVSNPSSPVASTSSANPFRRRKPPPPPPVKSKPRPPPISTLKPRLSLKGKERTPTVADASTPATTSGLKGKLGNASSIWGRRRTVPGPASPSTASFDIDDGQGAESPVSATTPTTGDIFSLTTPASAMLDVQCQSTSVAPTSESPLTPTTPTNTSMSSLPPRLASASASASSSSSASSGLIPVSSTVSSSQSLASGSPSSPTSPENTSSVSTPSSPTLSTASTPTPARPPFIKRAIHAPLSRPESPAAEPALYALAAERTPSPPPPSLPAKSSPAVTTKGKEREVIHGASNPAQGGSSALRERLGMSPSTIWGRRHTVPAPGLPKPVAVDGTASGDVSAGTAATPAKNTSRSTTPVAFESSASASASSGSYVRPAIETKPFITRGASRPSKITMLPAPTPLSPPTPPPHVLLVTATATSPAPASSPSSHASVTPAMLSSSPTSTSDGPAAQTSSIQSVKPLISSPAGSGASTEPSSPSTPDTPTSAYELFAAKTVSGTTRRPAPPSASPAVQALAAKRAPPPPPPPRPVHPRREPPPVPPRIGSGSFDSTVKGHVRTHSAPTPFAGTHSEPTQQAQMEAEPPSSPLSLHAPPSPSRAMPPSRPYAPVRPSPLAQPPVPAESPPNANVDSSTLILRVPVPPRSDSSSATVRAPAASPSPVWTPLQSPMSSTAGDTDYATAGDGETDVRESRGVDMERTESLIDLYDHSPEPSSADVNDGDVHMEMNLPRLPEDLPPPDLPLPAPTARAAAWTSLLPSQTSIPSAAITPPALPPAREDHHPAGRRPLPLPPGGGSRQPMIPPIPFSRPTTPRETSELAVSAASTPGVTPRTHLVPSSARIAPSTRPALGTSASDPQGLSSPSSVRLARPHQPQSRPSTPSLRERAAPVARVAEHAHTVTPLPPPGSNTSATVSRAPTPASAASTAELSELDILLSRLDTADGRAGENYEDLLRVADILGPARPARHPGSAVMNARRGEVKCTRRRVTKDGRTKLKLELLGTSVDKCGICLAQMRDGEAGTRAEECRHAFHEKCLRRWLTQRGTCPNCREPLQMEA
ncbi:unnamed protein product [Peniophora sp. CBMAI 1063]|nr:unnamed protein product [Peniophora sp. CBMAI 1063]